MKLTALALPLAVLAASPTLIASARAQDAEAKLEQAGRNALSPKEQSASIAFANQRGIRDWRAEGTEAVYLQDQHGQWFKATLMGRAIDLPFVQTIGFETNPDGSLDKFGAISVKGQRYAFSAFEKVAGPPAKADAKAP